MMALFIVLLSLALSLCGAGFAIHLLWWLLIVVLVIAHPRLAVRTPPRLSETRRRA
jgi:hypothetical protein